MKKLLYPFFALGLLALVSCEDDEPVKIPEPLPVDAVSYNGKNYSIENGTIIDWGAWEDYYNYDVFLTDGVMDFENETADDATIVIYAELWSPGTEKFQTGTFAYDSAGGPKGKPFFKHVDVVVESNNNGQIDENDERLTVKAGTFKISGSGTNFNVEVDFTLNNNKSLKGTYSGNFEKFDGTIIEESAPGLRMGKPAKFKMK